MIIIPGVYICVILLHKDSLDHNNADIMSSDLHVWIFLLSIVN